MGLVGLVMIDCISLTGYLNEWYGGSRRCCIYGYTGDSLAGDRELGMGVLADI